MHPSYRMLLYSPLSTKCHNFSIQDSDNRDNENENFVIFYIYKMQIHVTKFQNKQFRLSVPPRPFLTHPVL